MRDRVAQLVLVSPVLFSLYVNDTTSPSHNAHLVLYAKESDIIATFRKPTLLVSYRESNLKIFNGG